MRLAIDTPTILNAAPARSCEASERPSDVDAFRARIKQAIADHLRTRRGLRADWAGREPDVYVRKGGRLKNRGSR